MTTIDDLFKKKKSDTLVIFGSGPSIKNLSKDDLKILQQYDTLSFNMFAKTGISTDMYIIGEKLHHYNISTQKQDIIKSKEDPNNYLELFTNEAYKDTFFVFWNHNTVLSHKKLIDEKISQKKLFLKTICLGCDTNYQNKCNYTPNFFKKHKILLHQNVGLNSCIFLGVSMGYKNIIFSGVDLNDYTYAFDRTYFREKIIKEIEDIPHRSHRHAFSFIHYLKDTINFSVYNSDSKLTQIIPVYNK